MTILMSLCKPIPAHHCVIRLAFFESSVMALIFVILLEMWHWFWFTSLLGRCSPGVFTCSFLSWWPLIHRSGRLLSTYIPTIYSRPRGITTKWIWHYLAHCKIVWAQTPFISWLSLIPTQPMTRNRHYLRASNKPWKVCFSSFPSAHSLY